MAGIVAEEADRSRTSWPHSPYFVLSEAALVLVLEKIETRKDEYEYEYACEYEFEVRCARRWT
ncbi:hypothetical protein BH09SUM1_BH09SUM1_05730 [soil metagenome]